MSSSPDTLPTATRSGRAVKAPHRVPHVITVESPSSRTASKTKTVEKKKPNPVIVDCPPEEEGDIPPVPTFPKNRVYGAYDTPDWDRFLTCPLPGESTNKLAIGDCVEFENSEADSEDSDTRYGCIVEIRAQRWRQSRTALQRLREPKNFRILVLTFLTKPLLQETADHSLIENVERKDESNDRQLFATCHAAWITPSVIFGKLHITRIDPKDVSPPSGLFYDYVYHVDTTSGDSQSYMIPAMNNGHPLWPFKIVNIHNWHGYSTQKPDPLLKYWNEKIFQRYLNFRATDQTQNGLIASLDLGSSPQKSDTPRGVVRAPRSSKATPSSSSAPEPENIKSAVRTPKSSIVTPSSTSAAKPDAISSAARAPKPSIPTPSSSSHVLKVGGSSAELSPSARRISLASILGKRARARANDSSPSESDQLMSSDEEESATAKGKKTLVSSSALRNSRKPSAKKRPGPKSPRKAKMSFSMAMISGDGKITWKRESEGAGAKGTQGGTVMMIDTPGPSASASANMNVDVNENESNEYSSRQSATPDREGDLVYPEDMDQNPTLNNIPFPPEMLVPAPALESQNIHHDASRNLRSSTPPSMSSITLLNEDPNGPLGMQNRDDGVHSGSLAPEKIHSGSENIIKLGTDRETTSSFAGTPTSTETQGNKVIMGIGQTDVQVELGNLGPSNQILGSSSGAIIPPVNALDNMIMDSFVPLDTTFSPNIPAMNSTLPSPSVNIVEVNASDEDQARRMRMVDEKMAEPVNSVGLEPVVNARKSLPLESEALNGNSEDAGAAVIAQVFNTRTLRNAQRGTASETQIENVLPGHDTAQRRLSLTVEERDNALVEHDAAQEAHFRLKKSSDSAKRKKDLAVAIKERDAAMVERDTALADKKDLEEELGVAVQSRDAAVAEHHALLADNQKLRKDLDMIIQERDAVMLERDGMLAENRKLEEQMRIYKEYYASGVKLGL